MALLPLSVSRSPLPCAFFRFCVSLPSPMWRLCLTIVCPICSPLPTATPYTYTLHSTLYTVHTPSFAFSRIPSGRWISVLADHQCKSFPVGMSRIAAAETRQEHTVRLRWGASGMFPSHVPTGISTVGPTSVKLVVGIARPSVQCAFALPRRDTLTLRLVTQLWLQLKGPRGVQDRAAPKPAILAWAQP